MAGASMLAVECDPERIEKRLASGYLDRSTTELSDAIEIIEESCRQKKPISVGLLGNAADIFPLLYKQGIHPDIVTDQTSAHDPLNGYLPLSYTLESAAVARKQAPEAFIRDAKASMAVHVKSMLDFQKAGIPTFDYGNNIREMAKEAGVTNAFDFPGFVPKYIRPLFTKGIGPFRWVALSGDPDDIAVTDHCVKSLLPEHYRLHRWLDLAAEKIQFQGLPARICWLGLKERAKIGVAFNELVASGAVKAPIVIGRDHLDSALLLALIEKLKLC